MLALVNRVAEAEIAVGLDAGASRTLDRVLSPKYPVHRDTLLRQRRLRDRAMLCAVPQHRQFALV